MKLYFRKYRFVAMSTSLVLAAAVLTPVSQLLPGPTTFEGKCRVSVGSTGGQRFASIKCQKTSNPGVDFINGIHWENRSKKEFDNMARFSGQRMTCKFQKSGTSSGGDEVFELYKIVECK